MIAVGARSSDNHRARAGARALADLPEHRRAVHVMQAFNRFFTRAYHHIDVIAPCRLPKRGRAIIVCNHTSGLDPNLIQSCCKRLIIWMMAQEYADVPIVGPLTKILGVIPVARNGRDSAPARAALRALENEQILGIFPEGRIEQTRDLLPFQTGVALLAMKTDAPIVPAYLDGTQRGLEMLSAFFRPQRATLAFGEPIRLSRSDGTRPDLDAATETIKSAILSLQATADNYRSSGRL
jgi:1-acyl-sn-glycerol-3-phosphate acyltransferase